MRSIKLTAASACAAAVLTLAPALASAAAGHTPHRLRRLTAGDCRTTLNVAPSPITSGEPVAAYGHLSCPSTIEEKNQKVTLYAGTAPSYTVAGEGTTNEEGFYKIETAPLTANTVFHVVAGTAQSRRRSVKVAAQVTLTGPSEGTQLLAGRRAGGRSR